MTLSALLPCPFCGASAKVSYSDRGEVFNVRCEKWTGDAGSTSCMGAGAYAHTEAEAIAAWNRRPSEKGLVDAIKKAEQLADIAADWNLTEVEIDGAMVNIYDLRNEFRAARPVAPLATPKTEV
jgi:hypothetical protein